MNDNKDRLVELAVFGFVIALILNAVFSIATRTINNEVRYINQKGHTNVIDVPNDAYFDNYRWEANCLVIEFTERKYDGFH